jgi:hypothetical protein
MTRLHVSHHISSYHNLPDSILWSSQLVYLHPIEVPSVHISVPKLPALFGMFHQMKCRRRMVDLCNTRKPAQLREPKGCGQYPSTWMCWTKMYYPAVRSRFPDSGNCTETPVRRLLLARHHSEQILFFRIYIFRLLEVSSQVPN